MPNNESRSEDIKNLVAVYTNSTDGDEFSFFSKESSVGMFVCFPDDTVIHLEESSMNVDSTVLFVIESYNSDRDTFIITCHSGSIEIKCDDVEEFILDTPEI